MSGRIDYNYYYTLIQTLVIHLFNMTHICASLTIFLDIDVKGNIHVFFIYIFVAEYVGHDRPQGAATKLARNHGGNKITIQSTHAYFI